MPKNETHARSQREPGLLARVLQSGSFAGLLTTAAVGLLGMREGRGAVAPVNATSHVLWGDEARTASTTDLKHTLPGVLINGSAGIFWALAHELLLSRLPRRTPATVMASSAAVATLAYAVDYHLIPRRLTPGWELRLSRRSVAADFAVLGLSLAIAALLRDRR